MGVGTGRRPTHRMFRASRTRIMALVLAVNLLVTPSLAGAESAGGRFQEGWAEDAAFSTLDVLLLRPFGMGRMLAGAVLFVPVTMIWPPAYKETFDQFVQEPYEYTIEREIGQDIAGI